MEILQAFSIAFLFSFIGSIPPGTINITVIQLTLNNKKNSAVQFSLAAATVEFFYGAFAVGIQTIFIGLGDFNYNFQFKIIAATAMIILGLLNLRPRKRKPENKTLFHRISGFKMGVIISLLNPLAIPFWLAVTTYLQSQNWVEIDQRTFWFYILGISSGTFLLLTTLVFFASRLPVKIQNNKLIDKITGIIFLSLGVYTILQITF